MNADNSTSRNASDLLVYIAVMAMAYNHGPEWVWWMLVIPFVLGLIAAIVAFMLGNK